MNVLVLDEIVPCDTSRSSFVSAEAGWPSIRKNLAPEKLISRPELAPFPSIPKSENGTPFGTRIEYVAPLISTRSCTLRALRRTVLSAAVLPEICPETWMDRSVPL